MQAQTEIKQFSGLMDTDSSNETIAPTSHKYARNIRIRNGRVETIEGAIAIPNPYIPAGTNETMYGFFDQLRHRIITFSYNGSGTHGIYEYDLLTELWTRIIKVGYNTDGDILAFDLDSPIYAVKMLYGDSTQGDTLYWINSQREPCQVNIDKAIAGTYGTIKRTYIDVIKAPSILPPEVCYEDDATVTVNNLRKKLFQFAIRYVYLNGDKSVWSSRSKVPLPVNWTSSDVDKDPTKNCKIAIVIPTGEADVKNIEVAAFENEGTRFGDPYLIADINKSTASLSSNDITIIRFAKDQAYLPLDAEESQQLFDYVPLKAIALEFLNGNVPIYGAITEGFNKSTVAGTSTPSNVATQTTKKPFVLATSQSGNSGFGSGNIHAIVVGKITIGDVFNIYTTNQTITFTASAATTTNVITGLAAAAVVAGFTVVSSDTENLTIIKTGEALLRSLATPISSTVYYPSPVYDRYSRYNYSIVYLDGAGRSIGGLTSSGMSFQTLGYVWDSGTSTGNIPRIAFSITSRPPLHARYFHIARTRNLSKQRKIEWVSDRTYKDASFAYISIESLNAYISDNPSSKFLQYDFARGDRIRFLRQLSGSVNTVYTNNDFEIADQVLNPTVGGINYKGQFLKITLPTTSGTFDFGSADFMNYHLELYTPAQSVSGGLDFYYEFGERYTIGNPGTATAYHQGQQQNQTPDLITPATFQFTEGDYYYRPREINTGNTISYNLEPQELQEKVIGFISPAQTDTILSQTLIKETIPSTDYNLAPIVPQGIYVDATGYSNTGFTILATAATVFNVKGQINLRAITATADTFGVHILVISSTGSSTIYSLGTFAGATAGQNITLTVNTSITMSVNSKAYLRFSDVSAPIDTAFRINLIGGNLNYTIATKTFTVYCIDPNFSDLFPSAVNSNGRQWIVDPNAAQVFNPTLMRWGLAYQPNTNINQTNTFKPLNFDEADRSRGQIQAFKVRQNELRIFFENGCGRAGIYAKFLTSNTGENTVTTTNDIITKNNIQYYNGEYGVGNQPTGLVSNQKVDYFIDPIRGYQIRLSQDGFTVVSELYKGEYFIQPLFIPYNKPFLRTNGKLAKILGYFDYAEEQYVTILQGGSLSLVTIDNYAFSFNEKRNAYCSFYDFDTTDFMLCANDVTYSFKNGVMYEHTDNGNNRTFYGTPFYPSIDLVFNGKEGLKKSFLSLGYQSNQNQKWVAENNGDIKTSWVNPQTGLQQESKLKDFNITISEGIKVSAFKRDLNSKQNKVEAWNEGDTLTGNWLQITLQYKGSDFSYLYLPYVKWVPSNKLF